jgi:peptide chain release factor 1
LDAIFDKLGPIVKRYEEIESTMALPEVATDFERVQTLAKERAGLEELVGISRRWQQLAEERVDLESMLRAENDPELAAMAREELEEVDAKIEELGRALRVALVPKNPNDERDVIVEVRSGTGGDEASLFAADLYRAYSRYAQLHNWKIDIMDSSASPLGGFNKMVFGVQGKGAYSRLKYERGVHRVQRIPETETQGRIHTSTATVAVLPQVDEVEIKIDPDTIRIDIFHAGGHGGQNVNKVATAVRIVYEPTGLTVTCQDERSQGQNKLKAMTVLRSRLYEMERRRKEEALSSERRSQVGTGERSEKVRTYNYPQNRVTDHRINYSSHNLEAFLDGDIDEMIDALSKDEREQRLEAALASS